MVSTDDSGRKKLGRDIIYNLVDIIEEGAALPQSRRQIHAELLQKFTEVAEDVAREMFPGIAERIIRQEIEHLKKQIEEEQVL